jgi:ABC-type nitrate/sulfonate/bicarbonate transport system permease component
MARIDPYGRLVPEERSWFYLGIAAIAWIIVLTVYCFFIPNWVSALKFPGPQLVLNAVHNIGPPLLTHALSTLSLVLIGFGIGSSFGILVGFIMFASAAVDSLLFSFIEFVRPVPPIALIPFFILWFGLNPAAQVALVALGCFLVMVVSTREALNKVSIEIRRAALSLGASGLSFYVDILLWAILPSLVAPLRVGLALAFALAVAAEFMGAQSGLGYLMMIARRTLQTETILLAVIILGLESAIMDWLLRTLLGRLLRWHS